jgi:hypothetical protein
MSLWFSAAWWASLSTLGFLAVPLLFVYLPTSTLAGATAARLFSAQTLVSCACCAGLLVLNFLRPEGVFDASTRPKTPWFVLLIGLGLLCAVGAEWVVAPRIVARQDLQLWHRVGSGMYLVQWLSALAVFQLLLRRQVAARPR